MDFWKATFNIKDMTDIDSQDRSNPSPESDLSTPDQKLEDIQPREVSITETPETEKITTADQLKEYLCNRVNYEDWSDNFKNIVGTLRNHKDISNHIEKSEFTTQQLLHLYYIYCQHRKYMSNTKEDTKAIITKIDETVKNEIDKGKYNLAQKEINDFRKETEKCFYYKYNNELADIINSIVDKIENEILKKQSS